MDGGRIKNEPWKVFAELEKELGIFPYFSERQFDKRPDGYYCVKPMIKKLLIKNK